MRRIKNLDNALALRSNFENMNHSTYIIKRQPDSFSFTNQVTLNPKVHKLAFVYLSNQLQQNIQKEK
jgi:hypothetical protein